MQPITTPLIVLHADPLLRERLGRAMDSSFEIRHVASWQELDQAVRQAPPTAVALVDPFFGSRSPDVLSPSLHALRKRLPSFTLVAAMEITPERWEALRTLGGWGTAQVVALDQEVTVAALRERLGSLRGRSLQTTVMRSLPESIGARARTILMHAAEVASVGGQAPLLGRRLEISQRSLLRSCVESGLPAPRRLLAWMRLLLAGMLLDDSDRTVSDVAATCGYFSDNTLRRAIHDFLHCNPSELRRRGALQTALRTFLDEIQPRGSAAGAPR